MNDMVSIRKMRSLPDLLFRAAGVEDATAAAAASVAGDFFREGKPVVYQPRGRAGMGQTLQKPLEIDREVGPHDLLAIARIVAEHQVIPDGLVVRGGKIEINILIVRRVRGEDRIRGAAAVQRRVLLLVQHQKVDVSRLLTVLNSLLSHERAIISLQPGDDGLGGNYEGKINRRRKGKGLAHDHAVGPYWRRQDVIVRIWLPRRSWAIFGSPRRLAVVHQLLERGNYGHDLPGVWQRRRTGLGLLSLLGLDDRWYFHLTEGTAVVHECEN